MIVCSKLNRVGLLSTGCSELEPVRKKVHVDSFRASQLQILHATVDVSKRSRRAGIRLGSHNIPTNVLEGYLRWCDINPANIAMSLCGSTLDQTFFSMWNSSARSFNELAKIGSNAAPKVQDKHDLDEPGKAEAHAQTPGTIAGGRVLPRASEHHSGICRCACHVNEHYF